MAESPSTSCFGRRLLPQPTCPLLTQTSRPTIYHLRRAAATIGMDAFHHFDVVFLDNQMPVCSGVEVVTELRSLGRNDLVIGVTANALQSDQEQYLEAGASFLLTKPVKEPDFIRYLRLADKRRAGRADPAQQIQRQATSSSQFPHFPSANSQ